MKTDNKNKPESQPTRPEPERQTTASLDRERWIARALAAAAQHNKGQG